MARPRAFYHAFGVSANTAKGCRSRWDVGLEVCVGVHVQSVFCESWLDVCATIELKSVSYVLGVCSCVCKAKGS